MLGDLHLARRQLRQQIRRRRHGARIGTDGRIAAGRLHIPDGAAPGALVLGGARAGGRRQMHARHNAGALARDLDEDVAGGWHGDGIAAAAIDVEVVEMEAGRAEDAGQLDGVEGGGWLRTGRNGEYKKGCKENHPLA